MDKTLEPVFMCFGAEFYNCINSLKGNINEVRIRSEKPVVVYIDGQALLVTKNGHTEPLKNYDYDGKYLSVSFKVLKNAFSKLCEYSVYKHQNDINNGFITVCGGHRIGICAAAVMTASGIKSVVDITSLNIRAAKQYIGCSDEFLKNVNTEKGVLICGVPSSGKTTLLRDLSRNLSVNFCKKISVIDERSEISSTFHGTSVFDMGFCDVYCGYPKEKAVIQAIRTMSPDYIICDELTGNDIQSVILTVNYGVKMIASVHCDCLENAKKNRSILRLIKTRAFGKLVFLESNGFCKINKIYSLEDINID